MIREFEKSMSPKEVNLNLGMGVVAIESPADFSRITGANRLALDCFTMTLVPQNKQKNKTPAVNAWALFINVSLSSFTFYSDSEQT